MRGGGGVPQTVDLEQRWWVGGSAKYFNAIGVDYWYGGVLGV